MLAAKSHSARIRDEALVGSYRSSHMGSLLSKLRKALKETAGKVSMQLDPRYYHPAVMIPQYPAPERLLHIAAGIQHDN